jgi:hypothetical protein
VGPAIVAGYFGSNHAEGPIFIFGYVFTDGGRKSRPAAATVEFGIGFKQGFAAANTLVLTTFEEFVINARERAVSCGFLGNAPLLISQAVAQFFFAYHLSISP